ncbi:MAG: hypothetical protein OXH75_11310 [Acidobacteria bacterium]|nr:hypothetical protein [Acidobacteriota bacterium]
MTTGRGRDRRGIYAWYVSAKGRKLLSQAGLKVRCDGLVYIGSTWTGFRKRTTQHVSRDLCETLTCVLGAIDPKPCDGDVKRFMRDHFSVAVMPVLVRPPSDPSAGRSPTQRRLRKEEHRLIRDAEPCLNRTSSTENAKRIAELARARAAASRRPGIRERAREHAAALASFVLRPFRADR